MAPAAALEVGVIVASAAYGSYQQRKLAEENAPKGPPPPVAASTLAPQNAAPLSQTVQQGEAAAATGGGTLQGQLPGEKTAGTAPGFAPLPSTGKLST